MSNRVGDIKLSKRQQQLYALLLGRGDVPIDDLYKALAPNPENVSSTPQMWLGSYITALNRKLADQRLKVEPGALKNTYRLVALEN